MEIMKYKTTYFKINLNSEISVTDDVYEYRINNEKLISEINKNQSELINIFSKYRVDLKINDLSISFLKEIQNSDHDIYKKNRFYPETGSQSYKVHSQVRSYIEDLIIKKEFYRDLNNQRFTNNHEQELNKHLNEIAEDGWKLFSMNPIIKGLKDYNYSSANYGSYGYGYGHSVLEGFVLVWEKHE
jgi:hypothetical protein